MYSSILIIIVQVLAASAASDHLFTSVWCHGSHQSHRHCAFSNLCFSPALNQFLFFHSRNESVISGVDSPAEQMRLARLSSLEGLEENEDDLFMDYTLLPDYLSKNYSVEFDDQQTLFIKRWKPNELQHVIHDDLIPIFFTMKFLCYGDAGECLKKYQIIITDAPSKQSRFEELYRKVLSPAKLKFLRDEDKSDEKKLICYKKAIVGLETETLWHDYGFYLNGHEGPRDNPNFRPSYLEEFRNFAFQQLDIEPSKNNVDVLLLVPEKPSRLKNFDEVTKIVRKAADVNIGIEARVETFDLNVNDVETLLSKASNAKMVIGVTDATMIASLFLPKTSAIVELFPFGLGPDVSSFIQTLATERGQVYHAWVNHIRSNSVSHPQNEPAFGGVAHLDKDVRRAIEHMEHVGDVKCCDDPAFLHKFYQDTIVEKDSFEHTLFNAFDDLEAKMDDVHAGVEDEKPDEWMLPSKIFGAKCQIKKPDDEGDKNLLAEVRWQEPLNLKLIPHKSVIYEVVAQADMFDETGSTDVIGEFSTHERVAEFTISRRKLRKYKNVKVWIAVVIDHDLRGTDTYVGCDIDSLLIM